MTGDERRGVRGAINFLAIYSTFTPRPLGSSFYTFSLFRLLSLAQRQLSFFTSCSLKLINTFARNLLGPTITGNRST